MTVGRAERADLSVVMNAKDVAPYLRAGIRSVVRQRGLDVQLVLVEHGSRDGAGSIVDEFAETHPDRVVVVREPDDGPAEGWYHGALAATADCVYFLNGDDFLPSPLALGRARRAHREAGEPAVLVANGFGCDADVTRYWPEIGGAPRLSGFVQETSIFFQQGSLWRRDVLVERDVLEFTNRVCWDGEAYLRVLGADELDVARAQLHVGCFRRVPTGISATSHAATLGHWYADRRRELGIDALRFPRWVKYAREPRQVVPTIVRRIPPVAEAWSRRLGWDASFVAALHGEASGVTG